MDYDAFKSLSEDEQRTAYIDGSNYADLEAERNSFKEENQKLKKQLADLKESERKTKELNYTLARKLDTGNKKDPDELLNEMMK